MKTIEIVTVTRLLPLFKEGVEAERILVPKFCFTEDETETGFNVVSQKGLYQVGSRACFFQPDYCLSSNISLFDSFTMPDGNPSKSMLGKMGRIRAKKFNFSLSPQDIEPVYSYGVLIPLQDVASFLGMTEDEVCKCENLDEILEFTKYVEPEKGSGAASGMTAGDFPSFLYKTDETLAANIPGRINKACEDNEVFDLSVKFDGSSITEYFRKNPMTGEWEYGICSRNQEKKLDQRYISSYIGVYGHEYTPYFNKEVGSMGFKSGDIWFAKDSVPENMTPVYTEVKDAWIELANKHLTEKCLAFCKEHDLQLAFRGEIYGEGLNGSGNKLNPHSKEKQNLVIFGIDDLSSGHAVRITNKPAFECVEGEWSFSKICEHLNLNYAKHISTNRFNSYQELVAHCNELFKFFKSSEGMVLEGIVVRTRYTNNISCKVMNPEYDSKK